MSSFGAEENHSNIVLGVTHLLVDGHAVRLLKCPFCNFRNIHEDTITHHIRYTDDAKHDVDVDQLDKSRFIVTGRITEKESPWGPYVRTEDLPLPCTGCLWCEYKDKIDFDLSLHFLERHKNPEELFSIPMTRREREAARALGAVFQNAMEYLLDKAVALAKQSNYTAELNKKE